MMKYKYILGSQRAIARLLSDQVAVISIFRWKYRSKICIKNANNLFRHYCDKILSQKYNFEVC